MMKKKYPASFRLSEEAMRVLAILSEQLGISQRAVLETAIRKLGKDNNVR